MACSFIYKNEEYSEKELSVILNKEASLDNVDSAREFLKETLGLSDNQISFTKGLIDNLALGKFKEDGSILLSYAADNNVVYHEAFHRVWNVSTTESDRKKVLDELKTRPNIKNIISDYNKLYNDVKVIESRNGKKLSENELLEEFLADEFAEYVIDKKSQDDKSLLRKIFDSILKYLNIINATNTVQLYENIINGRYKAINSSNYSGYAKYSLIKKPEKNSLTMSSEQLLDFNKQLSSKFTEYLILFEKFTEYNNTSHTSKQEMLEFYEEIIKVIADDYLTDTNQNNDVLTDFFKMFYNIEEYFEEFEITDASEKAEIIAERQKHFKFLMNEHQKYLKDYKLNRDDLIDALEEMDNSETQKDKAFNKKSFESDPRMNMDKSVRYLLSTIKYKPEKNMKDSLGFPKTYPMNKLISVFLDGLATIPPGYNTFRQAILNIGNTQLPDADIQSFVDMIFPEHNENLKSDLINVQASFIKSFSNSKLTVNTLTLSNDTLFLIDENNEAMVKSIKSQWASNLNKKLILHSPEDIIANLKTLLDNTYASLIVSKSTLKKQESLSSKYKEQEKNIIELGRIIGIDNIQEMYDSVRNYEKSGETTFKIYEKQLINFIDGLEYLVNSLIKDRNKKKDSYSQLYYSTKKNNKILNTKDTYAMKFSDLATIAGRITQVKELSITSATNNPLYSITNYNYIYQMIDKLNYNFKYGISQEEFSNPNTTNSVIFNKYKSSEVIQSKERSLMSTPMEVLIVSGINTPAGRIDFDKAGSLDYHLVGLMGAIDDKYYSVTQGDRSVYPMFNLNEISFDDTAFINYVKDDLVQAYLMSNYYSNYIDGISSNLEDNLMLEYVHPDIIKEFKEKIKNIPSPDSIEFDLFKIQNIADTLVNNVNNSKKIKNNFDEFLNKEKTHILNTLQKNNILGIEYASKGKPKINYHINPNNPMSGVARLLQKSIAANDTNLEDLIHKFAKNTYALKIEQFKLLYGTLGIFKNTPELGKRFNTPTSTGIPAVADKDTDPIVNNIEKELNDVKIVIDGNLIKYSKIREQYNLTPLEIKELFIDDIFGTSSEETYNLIYESFRQDMLANIKMLKFSDIDKYNELMKDKTKLDKFVNDYAENESEAYLKYEEADGFTYLNILEWKKTLTLWGEWTPEHDIFFNREIEILNIANSNLTAEEKSKVINAKITEASDNTVAAMIKPIYTGPVYLNGKQGSKLKSSVGNSNGLNLYAIRKTSFFPLLPSVIWNTRHLNLLNEMLINGDGMAFLKSSSKIGSLKSKYATDSVAMSKGDFKRKDNSVFTTIDYRYMKKSQVVAPKAKKQVPDATQSRKNIISTKFFKNIPIDYLNKSEASNLEEALSNWENLTEEEKRRESQYYTDVNDYIDTISIMIDKSRKDLLKELNILVADIATSSDNSANESLTYLTQDVEKILNVIKQESIDRNEAINILDALDYLIENNSKILDGLPNGNKIESLISSLVTNRVIKNKRYGDNKAQNAVTFWSNSDRELKEIIEIKNGKEEKSYQYIASEDVKFYRTDENGNLLPAECIIPTPPKLRDGARKLLKNALIKKARQQDLTQREQEIFECFIEVKKDFGFNDKLRIPKNLKKESEKLNTHLITSVLNKMIDKNYLDEELIFKGVRIPNQEMSSNDIIKVKKFITPTLETFIVLPSEIVAKTGSDFDIDKMMLYYNTLDINLNVMDYDISDTLEAFEKRYNNYNVQILNEIEEEALKLTSLEDVSSREVKKAFDKLKNKNNEIIEFNALRLFNDSKLGINSKQADELYNYIIDNYIDNDLENLINIHITNNDSAKNKLKILTQVLIYIQLESFNGNQILDENQQIITDFMTAYNDSKETIYEVISNNINDNKDKLKSQIKDLNTSLINNEETSTEIYDYSDDELAAALEDDSLRITNELETFLKENDAINNAILHIASSVASGVVENYNQLPLLEDLKKQAFAERFPTPIEQLTKDALNNKLLNIEKNLILSNPGDLFHTVGDGGLRKFVVTSKKATTETQGIIDKYIEIGNKIAMYPRVSYLQDSNSKLTDALTMKFSENKKLDTQDAGMGIALVANSGTAHATQQIIKFNTSEEAPFKVYKDRKTEIKIPITIPINGGIQPDLSKTISNGDTINKIMYTISGYLTTQVDMNKDTYSIQLMIKEKTLNIVTFLVRNGIDPQIIHEFLVHPAISDYITYRSSFDSPITKSVTSNTNKEIINSFLNKIGSNVKYPDIFKIVNPSEITIDFIIKNMDNKKSMDKVLGAFLIIDAMASQIENVRASTADDTAFYKNGNDYLEAKKRLKTAKESGLFDNSTLDLITKEGLLKSFNKSAELYYYPWQQVFLSKRNSKVNLPFIFDQLGNKLKILSKNDVDRKSRYIRDMGFQFPLYLLLKSKNDFKIGNFSRNEILGIKNNESFNFMKFSNIVGKQILELQINNPDNQILNNIEVSTVDGHHLLNFKLPSTTTSEINNAINEIKILLTNNKLFNSEGKAINGELLAYQLTVQNMIQTRNNLGTFNISNINPGSVKANLLDEIAKEFVKLEDRLSKNDQLFESFFNDFERSFLLSNPQHIYAKSNQPFTRVRLKGGIDVFQISEAKKDNWVAIPGNATLGSTYDQNYQFFSKEDYISVYDTLYKINKEANVKNPERETSLEIINDIDSISDIEKRAINEFTNSQIQNDYKFKYFIPDQFGNFRIDGFPVSLGGMIQLDSENMQLIVASTGALIGNITYNPALNVFDVALEDESKWILTLDTDMKADDKINKKNALNKIGIDSLTNREANAIVNNPYTIIPRTALKINKFREFKPLNLSIIPVRGININDLMGIKEDQTKSETSTTIQGQENNIISSIYSQLGNKTVSENVRIEPWKSLKDITNPITEINGIPVHVISTRIKDSNQHFGNPFSRDLAGKTQGLIKTETIKEAVEKYIDWILIEDIDNITDEKLLKLTGLNDESIAEIKLNDFENQRQWIREQLKSGELKGKPILYYKELGEPSHATALDYLINKYDWNSENQLQNQPQNTNIEDINYTPSNTSLEQKTNFMGYNGYISIRDNNLKSFIDGNPSDAYLVVNKNKTDLKDINISNLSADEIIRIIKCKM